MELVNAIDVSEELKYCITTLHAIADSEENSETAMDAIIMIKDLIVLQTNMNAKIFEMNNRTRRNGE